MEQLTQWRTACEQASEKERWSATKSDQKEEPSYSRPGVSYDNAYSEALFKTTKYRPGFAHKGFESIEDAREWCAQFVSRYNKEHKQIALKFVTPGQRQRGEEIGILAGRDELR